MNETATDSSKDNTIVITTAVNHRNTYDEVGTAPITRYLKQGKEKNSSQQPSRSSGYNTSLQNVETLSNGDRRTSYAESDAQEGDDEYSSEHIFDPLRHFVDNFDKF